MANDTPLHLAAKEGRYKICKLFLEHPSADINAKNRFDISLIFFPQQYRPDCIILLLLDTCVGFAGSSQLSGCVFVFSAFDQTQNELE